jgi:glutathione S-transferase
MATTLYEIFWSHFCEKARWCLDYKRISYTLVAVNPLTRREARALGVRGDVPVLRDGARVLDGSAAIAAYLEDTYPDPPLLPIDPMARRTVLQIERRCDSELGPDARRLGYHEALAHPVLLEGTLLWRRAPRRWLNWLMLRFVDPRIRRKFDVRPDRLPPSRARLRELLTDLQARLTPAGFLVGDRITLADITAAALMDPLEIVPDFVRDPIFAQLFDWKRSLMRRHGRRQRSAWLAGPPPPGYPRLYEETPGSPTRGVA